MYGVQLVFYAPQPGGNGSSINGLSISVFTFDVDSVVGIWVLRYIVPPPDTGVKPSLLEPGGKFVGTCQQATAVVWHMIGMTGYGGGARPPVPRATNHSRRRTGSAG